jgi:polyphosphate kinase 2 (PPK2 family)
MLAKTDTAVAPWTIVAAQDRRFATVKVFRTIINSLEEKIRAARQKEPGGDRVHVQAQNPTSSILDQADLTLALTRTEYEKALKRAQDRIAELEHHAYIHRIPVVIVYEGWDASGKGGNIRRLVQGMDPRGYEVIPIAAPTEVEKSHAYLWRFWKRFPKAGHIAIFDRSWYGRVLVERVEGFATPEEWKRAYKEINEMEEQWVNFGSALVKFWIHVDQDEQLRRFREREDNPYKKWKITEEDWRNREKWAQYKSAVDEMLYRTSTAYAPWTIVEGNCKLHARIKTLRTVQAAIEERL